MEDGSETNKEINNTIPTTAARSNFVPPTIKAHTLYPNKSSLTRPTLRTISESAYTNVRSSSRATAWLNTETNHGMRWLGGFVLDRSRYCLLCVRGGGRRHAMCTKAKSVTGQQTLTYTPLGTNNLLGSCRRVSFLF